MVNDPFEIVINLIAAQHDFSHELNGPGGHFRPGNGKCYKTVIDPGT